MNQLKCTPANCRHNLKQRCNATSIGVNEKGVCDSKIKRAGGTLEQTFAELEAADDMLKEAPEAVRCDAQCLYNTDNKCGASAILVSDTVFKTKCKTRVEPK